ncbi:carbon storage regulator [Candidatus Scalindua japonica]|uniref:Carbon storage regulator n=1 Tax=Candidatus Scalindua japonica TaxID=1284222 RepID=A0A286TWA9_9BACT|nr:carbon storage regulator [Candidatus Scalindua japonica]GAX60162.1 carbon storage regulator [Candidatus Scalindua japonica]
MKIGDDLSATVIAIFKKKINLLVRNVEDTMIKLRLDVPITIKDDIKTTLTNIKKDQIKLGIEAPVEVRIEREKIQVLTKEKNS